VVSVGGAQSTLQIIPKHQMKSIDLLWSRREWVRIEVQRHPAISPESCCLLALVIFCFSR